MNDFGLKVKSFFKGKIFACVIWTLSVIAPWLFYSCRVGHVFVDIVLFDSFCQMLFWLMVINAIAVTALCFLTLNADRFKIKEKREKPFFIASAVAMGLTLFFTVVWIAFLCVMGTESMPVAGRMMSRTAVIFLLCVAVMFFALFFPAIKNKAVRMAVVIVAGAGFVLGTVATLYPFGAYGFLSDPTVLDTGKEYSVVFATTDKGTGYLEYEWEGETYKIFDEEGGRKVNAMIHSISVPYEHLDGNVYKIGSTRVIDELSYGGRSGKTVVSKDYKFQRNRGAEQNLLCVSDWHTRLDKAYKAIAHLGDYDGIILLGDAAPGFQFEEEAAVYLVKFSGTLSKGVKPVVYARGNHETRGAYAANFPSALGVDTFYTDIDMGEYRFIILDSAEDKEDSHPEYGGMNDYKAYRERMVEWLESLPEDATKKTVIISHDHKLCREEDLALRALDELKRLDASIILGGHYHEVDFGEIGGIPYYIDGGHTGKDFIASKVILTDNGIELKAVNGKGEVLFEKTVSYAANNAK